MSLRVILCILWDLKVWEFMSLTFEKCSWIFIYLIFLLSIYFQFSLFGTFITVYLFSNFLVFLPLVLKLFLLFYFYKVFSTFWVIIFLSSLSLAISEESIRICQFWCLSSFSACFLTLQSWGHWVVIFWTVSLLFSLGCEHLANSAFTNTQLDFHVFDFILIHMTQSTTIIIFQTCLSF